MKRVLWCAVVLAASAMAPAAQGQGRDYTAGFERLFLLGLPDVTDAEYVNVSFQFHVSMSGSDHNWRNIKLSGNAWRLEELDDERTRYLHNEGRVSDVYTPQRLQQLRRDEAKERGEDAMQHMGGWGVQDGRAAGTATPADLEADLKKLTEYLNEGGDDGQGMRRHTLDAISGRVFIFAALAHRKGYSAEASALVDTLFEKAEDPREVILRGLDHLAEQQYDDVFAAWERSGDWTAYSEAMGELIARFRAGWQMAPVAERVQGLVRYRLENPEPPNVEGLSEEDQEWARALVHAESPPLHRQHGFWIFPRAQYRQAGFVGRDDPDHPIARIKAGGLDSIPMLLALLDDEYLTSMKLGPVMGGSFRFGHQRNRPLDDAAMRRLFDSLPRPATRSDVARALLGALVREREHDAVAGKSVDDIRSAAEAWISQYGDMSLNEIALAYLDEGFKDQRNAAGMHLLHSGDEALIDRVDRAIREAADPVEVSDLAMSYSRMRSRDGDETIKAYIELLRDAVENLDSQRSWQKQQLERTIKQLEEIVSGETTATYLEPVLAGERVIEVGTITRHLGRESKREGVRVLLTSALKADDPDLRGSLLTPLFSHAHWGRTQVMFMQQQDDDPVGPWAIDDYVEEWSELLKDERPVAGFPMMAPAPLNVRAAHTILVLSYPAQALGEFHLFLGRVGSRGHAMLLDWARERLEGEVPPLPELPVSGGASEEEIARIRSQLIEADGDELAARLEALSATDISVLYDIVAEDGELAGHLVAYANRVVSVRAFPGAEEDASVTGLIRDRHVTEDVVRAVLDKVRRQGGAGESYAVMFTRGTALDGFAVQYGPMENVPRHMRVLSTTPDEAQVAGSIRVPGSTPIFVRWPLAAEESEPAAGGDEFDLLDEMLAEFDDQRARSDDAQRDAFWSGLADMQTADVSPMYNAMILLEAQLPKKKDAEDAEDEAE